jgi:hypothetical protein
MLAGYSVMQRTITQRDLYQIAAGLFHCLLYGNRNFLGTTLAHTDAAIAITNDGQGGESHDTAALNHFGDAVDADHSRPDRRHDLPFRA